MARSKADDILWGFVGGLTKFKDDNGHYIVRGVATDDTLDLDKQICDAEWLSTAIPDWFKSRGNIRAMHQPVAAGRATDLEQKGSGWVVSAKIVDADAIAKLEEGVYQGFSIGIKNARVDRSEAALKRAPNGVIKAGDVVEVSLVDVPANPNARLELAKMADGVLTKTEVVDPSECPPCPTCGGIGEVVNGDDPGNFTECPDCGGSGEGESTLAPSIGADGGIRNAGGGDGMDDDKAAEPDPDCETCGGTGKIRDGHVDCPDCVQGKSITLTDYFGFSPTDEVSDEDKAAMAEVVKKEYSDKERKSMSQSGEAMPGGGFPIKTVQDLKNAIRAIGRAKNPAAAKAHIKRRAKALGRTDLIPDNWKALEATLLKFAQVTKSGSDDQWKHDPTVLASVRDGLIECLSGELSELSEGEDEIWDIRNLVEVLGGFLSWWNSESWQGEVSGPAGGEDDDMTPTFVSLGLDPDVVKAATAEDATDEAKAALKTEFVKALGFDPEAIAKIAGLEADLQGARGEVEALTARIEVAEKMVGPRGISLRPTEEQRGNAARAEELENQAKRLRVAAGSTTLDQANKQAYLDAADQAEAQAKALRADNNI